MALVSAFNLQVPGGGLTGLRAGPSGQARGLVLALHGGGYDARYWHHPGHEQASLLLLGAARGFDMIAFDRPGYAGGAASWPRGLALVGQAGLIFDAIAELDEGEGRPVFLVGHSMGGILSLRMGADPRGAALGGIDVSGVPMRFGEAFHDALRARHAGLIEAGATHAPLMLPGDRRAVFFGAEGSFDPALVAPGGTEHPVPTIEVADAVDSPGQLPSLLERIAAPVQWTLADEEHVFDAGPDLLEDVARLLTRSRQVRTARQPGSGHNISLHHVARDYHRRALDFFDGCLRRECATGPRRSS